MDVSTDSIDILTDLDFYAIPQDVKDSIQVFAAVDTPLLIRATSTTIRELIAKATHFYKYGNLSKFTSVNCSSILDNDFDIKFFGELAQSHQAKLTSRRPGFLFNPDTETVFIDEVECIPLRCQYSIYRAIHKKEIMPVGSNSVIRISTRPILGTSKDLFAELDTGTFRHDLYYALAPFLLPVPALAMNPERVTIIANNLLAKYAAQFHTNMLRIGDNAMIALGRYGWPGDVEELDSTLRRAVLFCKDATITSTDTGHYLDTEEIMVEQPSDLKDALRVYEREYIRQSLLRNSDDRPKTAKELGISLSSLYRKIEEFRR